VNWRRAGKEALGISGYRENGVFESGLESRGRFSRNEVSSSQGETEGRRVADRKPTKPAIQPRGSVLANGFNSTGHPHHDVVFSFTRKGALL
jgi:hypothetical protein